MNSSAYERAVYTVRYCLTSLINNSAKRYDYCMEQESYSRWAARELLACLERNPDVPPLITIENFRDKMDEYSCVNLKTSYIFSCAKDIAEWIIDLLIS